MAVERVKTRSKKTTKHKWAIWKTSHSYPVVVSGAELDQHDFYNMILTFNRYYSHIAKSLNKITHQSESEIF